MPIPGPDERPDLYDGYDPQPGAPSYPAEGWKRIMEELRQSDTSRRSEKTDDHPELAHTRHSSVGNRPCASSTQRRPR